MMSRGTYLRSSVSFLASSSQLRWRVLNLDAARLSSGRHRWKCSYQYGLSESEYVLIRLIDDFRAPPALHSPPRGANWLMSGSWWYFHIDTSIDDGAAGTSRIDQLVRGPRFIGFCLRGKDDLGTCVGERWSLCSDSCGENWLNVLLGRVALGQQCILGHSKDRRGVMAFYVPYF